MTEWLALHPHDTLFFRDGRPFNQDDGGLASAESVFPPPSPSLIGGFRAATALRNGWPGHGSWVGCHDLGQQLGDGDDLGKLRFQGPILARTEEEEGKALQPLFAVPLHVLAKVQEAIEAPLLLHPSMEVGLETDVAESNGDAADHQMLEPAGGEDAKGKKAPSNFLITKDGLDDVLAGRIPNSRAFLHQSMLWNTEERIGLARDSRSHSARHGMLYLADHIRLNRRTRLLLGVDGFVSELTRPKLGSFGRFRRLADIEAMEHQPIMPRSVLPSVNDGVCRYIVMLTTPARIEDEGWHTIGGRLFSEGAPLPGTIVTAATERPVWIGGWRDGSYGEQSGPKDLEPYLPAGSVWFMEDRSGDLEALNRLKDIGRIGSRTEWGFGGCLIGRWAETVFSKTES